MTNKKLNWLCYKCIGDSEIKKRIQEQGKEKKCFYCGELRISIEIRKLATWIDKVYRKYYSSAPYYFVSVCQPAQVEGKNPEEIIAEMVEADKEIANLIVDYLSKEEERRVIKKGESPLYNSSNKYKRIDKSPDELHDMWKLFKKRIQYQRRFFANEAEKLLESILKGIEKFAEKDSLSPVRWLEPNDSKHIYRARIANTPKEVKKIIENTPKSLAPPPPEKNRGGRMNPSGISVFYGSFNEETCIAEVRPIVGGLVVVGKFEVIKPLKLLDLTNFNKPLPDVSMFRNNYDQIVFQWQFLYDFHRLISKPVQPHEESIKYIPTQVVAEYIANELKYDGVIYSSAQLISDEFNNLEGLENIVLFDAQKIIKDVYYNELKFYSKINKKFLEKYIDIDEEQINNDFSLKFISESEKIYEISSVNYTHNNRNLNEFDKQTGAFV